MRLSSGRRRRFTPTCGGQVVKDPLVGFPRLSSPPPPPLAGAPPILSHPLCASPTFACKSSRSYT
uniref:Uncharacterized protein n=1 Tax=Oryza meridionalis TaxID=40149 RepID=A0A0E0BXN6_9ORYZ